MAEPTPPKSVLAPGRVGHWPEALGRLASLALILEIALGLRVLAGDAIEWYVRRGGPDRLCVFPDTKIYWLLARTIRAGAPYDYVEWGDIPHFARRTPGYPLVLAACQTVFGERPLAVRLVQAVLGTLSVYLVYLLTRELAGPVRSGGVAQALEDTSPGAALGRASSRRWTIPLAAAAMAAINPYYVAMPAFVLSEAVFEPLMLAMLLGLAVLWPGRGGGDLARGAGPIGDRKAAWVALGTGIAAGSAVMVRPSWALFVPVSLAVWVVATLRDRRRRGSSLGSGLAAAATGAMLCAVGIGVVMGPWWYRNARIYGRFVPTALWMGASLYDGLNPRATGASDMTFLSDPEIWPLDELDQDAELTRRAVDFARRQPFRALELGIIKLGRYWSPWPNAEVLRSPALSIAGAAVELPIFALLALGAWHRRHDPRAWVLLAGPVLYFCALHTVFASSMRYRIPAEMPAVGLAAIGLSVISRRWSEVSGRKVVSGP